MLLSWVKMMLMRSAARPQAVGRLSCRVAGWGQSGRSAVSQQLERAQPKWAPLVATRSFESGASVGSAARAKREKERAAEARQAQHGGDAGEVPPEEDMAEAEPMEITDSFRFIHGESAAEDRGSHGEALLTTKGLRDWMRANCVKGDLAAPVLEFLQKQRVMFSRGIAHVLLEEYSVRHDTETIEVLVSRLAKENLIPSYRTYRILIEHFCNVVHDRERAFKLLEEMKARKDVQPDFEVYNSFLDMHAERGELKKVKALIDHLHDEKTFTFEMHMLRLKNHYKKQYDFPSPSVQLPKRLRYTEEFLPKDEAEDSFLEDSHVILYKEHEQPDDLF